MTNSQGENAETIVYVYQRFLENKSYDTVISTQVAKQEILNKSTKTKTNIIENHERFLEAGGNISQVKNFKSCSFKPMKLTNGKDDTPVLVQYPPDPLHVVYLGPANDLLSKLEQEYPEAMDEFYSENKMTKKGQGIGGTFNQRHS